MEPSPMRSTEPRSSKRTKVIAGTLAAILLTGVALVAIVQGEANRGWLSSINARQQRSEEARRQKTVSDLKALGQGLHSSPIR